MRPRGSFCVAKQKLASGARTRGWESFVQEAKLASGARATIFPYEYI